MNSFERWNFFYFNDRQRKRKNSPRDFNLIKRA